MYKNYRICVWVPFGRKRSCDLLFKYFIKYSDIIDEVMLCENTIIKEDLDFMHQTANAMPNLFKIYKVPPEHQYIVSPCQHNTGKFFEYMTDSNTIYVRFDDDIIYIDDDYFKNILDFRIEHPEYFIVFGNIVNNAYCAYQQQENGTFPRDVFNIPSGYCMEMSTWGNPVFAMYIHRLLLDRIKNNAVDQFYFPNKELVAERFSVSNFCFFGRDFAKFNGKIPMLDEEIFITEVYPAQHQVKNIVCGNAVVSHFTFSPYQKTVVLQTDILEQYRKIAEKKLSEDYYKLLMLEQNENGRP